MTPEQFDNVWEKLTSHGWLTREEGELLVATAEETAGNLVEVGSYQGRSARLLGELGRPLYCIDPWDDDFCDDITGEETYRRFLENTREVSDIIHPIRKRVEDAEPIPAGFVYLDGDHTFAGTQAQIRFALWCRPKRIAIHDVAGSGGGADVLRAATLALGVWSRKVGTLAVWDWR